MLLQGRDMLLPVPNHPHRVREKLEICGVRYLIGVETEYLWYERLCHNSEK